MKKRACWSLVFTLVPSVGALVGYALAHPVTTLLAMGPHVVVSDLAAKSNLWRVR